MPLERKTERRVADAFITGAATTAFGRLDFPGPLELMAKATYGAMADLEIDTGEIDGLVCGYATTLPHLMLSDLFAERMNLTPHYAQTMQLGGATGAAMLMLAADLVRCGRCRHVLVVAGENRLTGQSRDRSIQTLSQVGDEVTEVRNGASVPSYYALLASRYLHETDTKQEDLAELAVAMRNNAAQHDDAHLRTPISLDDVMASKPISEPLKLLDCCPISDGAAALLVSAEPGQGNAVALRGAGQAHGHQHISAIGDIMSCGAAEAAGQALAEAKMSVGDMDYLAIYDSFTITLAMLLEEIGFSPRGLSGGMARNGEFATTGSRPLNLHGGLLSFGHSGVAGGMAHVVEAVHQLRGTAGVRQADDPATAFVHADGGVMSAHVSLILERTG